MGLFTIEDVSDRKVKFHTLAVRACLIKKGKYYMKVAGDSACNVVCLNTGITGYISDADLVVPVTIHATVERDKVSE